MVPTMTGNQNVQEDIHGPNTPVAAATATATAAATTAPTPRERPPNGSANPLVTPGTTARPPRPTPEIMTAQALQYQQQVEKQQKEIENLRRSLSTTRALLQANGIGTTTNTNATVDANANTSSDAPASTAADTNTNTNPGDTPSGNNNSNTNGNTSGNPNRAAISITQTIGNGNNNRNTVGITTNPNTVDLTSEDPTEPTNQKPLSKAIETHSKTLQKAIHELKSTMQKSTDHLNAKQTALDKFDVPGHTVKSGRMDFTLHLHDTISPLLQGKFDALQEELAILLDQQQQKFTTLVHKHVGLMTQNLNHTRVLGLLHHSRVLLTMHLTGTILKTQSKSTLLSSKNTDQTMFRLLKQFISKLDHRVISYLMNKPTATEEETETYALEVIYPLFESLHGAHAPTAEDTIEPENLALIHSTADTVLKYLPHATVLHSESITQKRLNTAVTAAEEAAHSRAATTNATRATSEALGEEDTPQNLQTLKELIAAETKPYRDALKRSENNYKTLLKSLTLTGQLPKSKPKTKPTTKTATSAKPLGTKRPKLSSNNTTTATSRPTKRHKKVSFETPANQQPPTSASRGGRGRGRGRSSDRSNSNHKHSSSHRPRNTSNNNTPGRHQGRGRHNNSRGGRGGRGHTRGGPNRGRGRGSNRN